MKRSAVVFFAILALAGGSAAAQTAPAAESRSTQRSARLIELSLRDGSRLYGTIVAESDAEVVFRTQSGTTMTVTRAEVLSVRPVDGVLVDGEFQPADPNVTRMFFAPTGRSLKRGQVYLGLYEMFVPFVQVGLTDRISIGGGTPLIFFADGGNRPFWITPKVQIFNGDRTQVAVGAFHGWSGDEHAGIGYVVGTHGTTASSFTVGVGRGYTSEDGGGAVVMFGGERQTRRNLKVITENYLWSGGGFVSAGVRVFGEKMSTDVAAMVPVGGDFLFIGAVVNFVYIF